MYDDAHLEADYEDTHGAPHGEEQGQIDWLETRYDDEAEQPDWDLDECRYDELEDLEDLDGE